MLARVRRYLKRFRPAAPNGAVPAPVVGRPAAALPPAPKEVWTDYLRWLFWANAGMLHRGNLDCFDYVMRNLPSAAPIVEIGSFCGLSTNVLTYFKEQNGAKNPLITCDKWIFESAQAGGQLLGETHFLTHAEYREFIRGTFVRNVQTFSRYDPPHTLELFSDEFFTAWGQDQHLVDVFGHETQLGGPISFCYIDGNHSYEFARRDFENTDRFLQPGGFVLFDDSADGSSWEVCRVVREVLANGRYDLVANNPNYLFRKK